MKSQIIIGCDPANPDGDHTAVCAYGEKRGVVKVLELFRVKPNDPDYSRKIHEFALRWHPNFFRRWLFRLFRV